MPIDARPVIIAETPWGGRAYAEQHPELVDPLIVTCLEDAADVWASSLHCTEKWHENPEGFELHGWLKHRLTPTPQDENT